MTDNLPIIYGQGADAPEAPPPPSYSDTNLRSRMMAKILLCVGEGPVYGPPNPANFLNSIYVNDIPVYSAVGGVNVPGVTANWRSGTSTQSHIPGFEYPETITQINQEVRFDAPAGVVFSSTHSDVDAMRIIISFPEGMSYRHEQGNGSTFDATVALTIDTRDDALGVWYNYADVVTTGTTYSGDYTRAIRVEKPSGADNWSIRVRRLSADSTSFIKNKTYVAYVGEILDIKETYNYTALVAVSVDASQVGYSIPTISVDWKWLNDVRYPTNYNPLTHTYTGMWGGTFTQGWTDNPAWALMHLLLHVRSGTGESISIGDVDTGSFYSAAQYCDESVDDGNGGTEPRFTFNGTFQTRDDAVKQIQLMAGSFNAVLVWENGLWRLQQDRPATPLWQVTHANVVNGEFTYSSSPIQERNTVVHVTFTDKNEKYLPRPVTVSEPTLQAAYQYRDSEIAALGAVTEGQAVRVGRWFIHTSCKAYDTVKFTTGLESTAWRIGDLIRVYDSHVSGELLAGRVKLVSGSSVTLDGPITITDGATFVGTLANGHQAPEKLVLELAGTYDTLSLASGYTEDPPVNSVFGVITNIQPRVFRLLSVSQPENEATLREWTGILYDETKYAYLDGVDAIPINPYPSTYVTEVQPVTSIVWTPEFVNTGEAMVRRIHVSWNKSTTTTVIQYTVTWSRSGGNVYVAEKVATEHFIIEDGSAGDYQISVFAVDYNGAQSPAATSTYTLDLGAGSNILLSAVTGLQLTGIDGIDFHLSEWYGQDMYIKWQNPSSNNGLTAIKDFELRIYDNDTSTLKDTIYVDGVLPGEWQTYEYLYSTNVASGGASRNLRVEVRIRDGANKISAYADAVFTNPSPDVPNNLAFNSIIEGVSVRFDANNSDPDLSGYLLWGSTTNGFSLSQSTLLYDGNANYIPLLNLTPGATYYFRVAAYDTFGKSYDGVGLNVSSQQSQTATSAPGIDNVDVLPPTGAVDQIVYLTTDKKVYRWNGTSWDAVVGDILANSVTAAMMTANSVNTNNLVAGAVTAAKMTVTNLAAISADLGVITAGSINIGGKFIVNNDGTVDIHSATTGGRLQIISNVLKVYDNSNVLRVELGFLA